MLRVLKFWLLHFLVLGVRFEVLKKSHLKQMFGLCCLRFGLLELVIRA